MRVVPNLLTIAALAVAACSSTGSLDYTPTVAVAPGPTASVSAVTASDIRNEKPNRLATVRGGYGNPFYVRDLGRPVADEVATVFTKGLQTRGMLAASGDAPYRIQLVIRTFYGNQYLSRSAYIDMDLIVVDHAGRTVYQDAVNDKRDEFELFGASIESLQNLVQGLLNATVDRMLDHAKLRAALSGPRIRSVTPSA